jgi:hypothetical protein
MRICIATSDPSSSEYLMPLVAEAEDRDIRVVQLVPTDDLSRLTPFDTSSDLKVLATADVLLLAGSDSSAWSDLVLEAAHSRRLPVLAAQLEPVPYRRPGTLVTKRATHAVPEAMAATSERSASLLAHRFGAQRSAVSVIGNPAFDRLPAYEPMTDTLLLLVPPDAGLGDAGITLAAARATAERLGFAILPVPVPDGLGAPGLMTPELASIAAQCSVALGYPHSLFHPLAALGIPLVSLTTERWMVAESPRETLLLAHPVADLDDLATTLCAPHRLHPSVATSILGPVGGAAERLFDLLAQTSWLRDTTEADPRRSRPAPH